MNNYYNPFVKVVCSLAYNDTEWPLISSARTISPVLLESKHDLLDHGPSVSWLWEPDVAPANNQGWQGYHYGIPCLPSTIVTPNSL